jgi:Fe-S-cluster-containing dehydrogenase component/anaerobic selenocysteine-containing dehydrogenase
MENTQFEPPRHWIGPEELKASYWSDPKVLEKRGQEFHDKPLETLELIERMDADGLRRRDFLTIMGASMAMASFACARRPVHKIIPYVVKPEEIVPGVANWYASSCPDTAYGILIKTREGRPIKLEGNPEHPYNKGKLNSRTQAAILDLYDPDRLKTPLTRSRSGGAAKDESWEGVDAAISAKLKGARTVRVLTSRLYSPSTRKLVGEFLAAFPSGKLVEASVNGVSEAVQNEYRFADAEVIVSLGADFLGTWEGSVAHAQEWAKTRKLDGAKNAHAKMSRMYCFEPTMTVTGANADTRTGVRPGDELKVALAIAHELIVSRKRSRFAGDSAVSGALASYKPEAVAADIGIDAKLIQDAAEALWSARGKSLVLAGGLASRTESYEALQAAAGLLNAALDNEGTTIVGAGASHFDAESGFAPAVALADELKAGKVDVLIVYRSNPAYTFPKALSFSDAMKKAGTVIVVSDRDDETAKSADFVLPDHHFLENWGDSQARGNVISLQQPAIQPIHSTRAFQDSLLSWIRGGVRAGGSAARIAAAKEGENTWHDYLKAQWRDQISREFGASGGFDAFWEKTLQAGFVSRAGHGQSRPFRSGSLSSVPAFKAGGDDILLSLYETPHMGDGSQANNPWLQELPDPISTVTWDNWLNVGPTLAKELNVKTSDVLEISSGGVTAELPVIVQPGMHARTVSAALGYGRRHAGKVGTGVGVDLVPFLQLKNGSVVASGMPVRLRRTGKFYKLGETQWHHTAENRPVINDITLAQFREDAASAMHTDPHLRLETVPSIWPAHEYKGYRWGMAIDLSSCIGCGACSIACQAENNIPVVGRDNVRVSREMHWIRIDRYYSGSAENPDVLFQPMLCQHCENAPCETVCPVLATVHNDEGLNEQVYNRCVGTRYCQNNCPYKVRRFNFFDHWKKYESTQNLAWNPDVTVRTRGIMEKCTFCVQRIREAKDHAKDEGHRVTDGSVVTACQQTCPTDAIVFGDINDPNSRVSRLRGDARAFRSLEVLNTKPSISYLTKVRNKEVRANEAGSAGGVSHEEHHS